MADFTSLRTSINKAKAETQKLYTQLSEIGATTVSGSGSTAETGVLDKRVDVITTTIQALAKELSDIRAALVT